MVDPARAEDLFGDRGVTGVPHLEVAFGDRPPVGWTMTLAIRIFFTEAPACWWLPASGAAPVRSGRRGSATPGSTDVSVRPQQPGGHRPDSRYRDWGMNVAVGGETGTCRYAGNLARRRKTGRDLPVSRSGGGHRYGDAGSPGRSSPPWSNSTTPLYSRLLADMRVPSHGRAAGRYGGPQLAWRSVTGVTDQLVCLPSASDVGGELGA